MRILFDLDDLVIDLVSSWLILYNQDYDDDLVKEQINDWAIPEIVKPECGKKILDYLEDPLIYEQAEEIEGAIETIRKLVDDGYNLWFLTARYSSAKMDWLKNKGLFEIVPEERVIVSFYKYMINGDVLVDDYHENVMSFPGYGILFNQPWNKEIDYPNRADNWDEIYQMIVNYYDRYTSKEKDFSIPGMGTNVPTYVNERGGKQSKLDYRFDLIEPVTLFTLAQVLAEGARKYGKDNWKNIDITDNINHALAHIFAWLVGDKQDDHLGHAFTRLHFALWQDKVDDVS